MYMFLFNKCTVDYSVEIKFDKHREPILYTSWIEGFHPYFNSSHVQYLQIVKSHCSTKLIKLVVILSH